MARAGAERSPRHQRFRDRPRPSSNCSSVCGCDTSAVRRAGNRLRAAVFRAAGASLSESLITSSSCSVKIAASVAACSKSLSAFSGKPWREVLEYSLCQIHRSEASARRQEVDPQTFPPGQLDRGWRRVARQAGNGSERKQRRLYGLQEGKRCRELQTLAPGKVDVLRSNGDRLCAELVQPCCVFQPIPDTHFKRSRTAFQAKPDTVSN